MITLFVCFLTLSSIAEAGIRVGSRIRIDDVEINKDKPVQVGNQFNIEVNISKNGWSLFKRRFVGELRAYLICAGLPQKEIGKEDFIFKLTRKKTKDNVTISCQIKDIDANWYQERYNIKVMLYRNILGFSIRRDVFTKESVHIISKFLEKDKLKITKFEPPKNWTSESEERGSKKSVANVTMRNDGACDFDVKVVVYLVEEKPLGIPFLEGFGEERKEIGVNYIQDIEPQTEPNISIDCLVGETDWYTGKFDVRAVLFADVDGIFYEVDKSTIQTIKVESEDIIEAIKIHGPIIWLSFLAAIGTILLVAITLRVIWPLLKIKRSEMEIKRIEVEKKLQKVEEGQKKKKKE